MTTLDRMFLANKDPYALTKMTDAIYLVIYNSKTNQIENHKFDTRGNEVKI